MAKEKLAEKQREEKKKKRLKKGLYFRELGTLHLKLAKLQRYIVQEGLKVVVLFEGRDAAGKGGTIKRITEPLNPRVVRVVALGKPTEREKTQWYFQRYVAHLPAAGEMVLFDRSWYNRAGVERVMSFTSDEQYRAFIRSCPMFERLLIYSGIILIKYWFSVSDEVQEQRFQARIVPGQCISNGFPAKPQSRDISAIRQNPSLSHSQPSLTQSPSTCETRRCSGIRSMPMRRSSSSCQW